MLLFWCEQPKWLAALLFFAPFSLVRLFFFFFFGSAEYNTRDEFLGLADSLFFFGRVSAICERVVNKTVAEMGQLTAPLVLRHRY